MTIRRTQASKNNLAVGQRVKAVGVAGNPPIEGVIYEVIHGHRGLYYHIRADDGRCYHRTPGEVKKVLE
jgi:hypothetical protein